MLNKSATTGRRHQPWLVKVAKVANKRIRHALEWMAILFSQAGALSRTFHLANHWCDAQYSITVDASPWGGGAVLCLSGWPWGWLATPWDPNDELQVQSTIGDCASQATWESLIILVAIRAWIEL